MLFAVVMLVFLVVVWTLRSSPSKLKGMPPGEWGLPVIGALPPQGFILQDHFSKLRKKHGDIFSWRLGSRVMVILSDYNLIKTAFNNPNGEGRPDFYNCTILHYFQNEGLILSHGDVWQTGRRFTIRHLRDFGMGKNRLEGTIHREVEALVQVLEETSGLPNELDWSLNVAILNIIWSLVASRRYDINDKEINYFANLINDQSDTIQGPILLFTFMPWLIPLVPNYIKNHWMKIRQLEEGRDLVNEFFNNVVQEHKQTLDRENPRDYIDAFLIQKELEKDDPNSTFRADDQNLQACVADLFVAGSETTSSTLRWFTIFMALYPEVQQKAQKEIDEVVPGDTLPSLEHKEQLQYLDAVIHEVQRKASLLPLGVAHMATEDLTLGEYIIPKGTAIVPFLEHCHNSTKYFEKPDQFYPEHFLDDNGRCITKREGFAPFCLGRRQCLGESLARMELYLFAAAMLQRFTITSPPGVTLSTDTDRTKPYLNFVKPFKVVFTKRTSKTSSVA